MDLEAPPAFLKPMPTQRPPASGSSAPPSPVPPQLESGAESSTWTRLFPLRDPSDEGAPAADVAGLKLGHFVIEERIGRGGMGAVFRAIDQKLDRVVALKVLAPEHSRASGAVQRFHNEARAAARLDHENIARVYFFGEDQGLQFIAFEFVRGTNIRDFILQKGMLTPPQVVNYALQIAQALRHTHAAGVVHRDIKPSNIIITPSGRAKLVDLGLARQENAAPGSQELTVAGTTLGTFDYIAPEQARDPRNVDVRADIYSLGCTLYHMLTGEPPFPSGSMIQKVVDHHRGAAPDPAVLNPAVPPQLSRIVRKMMASNPDERYATPDHLVSELAAVAHAFGLRPEHPDGFVWTTPLFNRPSMLWLFWHQNRAWLLTIAVLLVIVIGINQIPWQQLLDQSSTVAGGQSLADTVVAPEPDSGSAASPVPRREGSEDETTLLPPPPAAPLPHPPLVSMPVPPTVVVTDASINSAVAGEPDESRMSERTGISTNHEATGTPVTGGEDTADPGDGGEVPGIAATNPFVLLEGETERYYPNLEAACLDAGADAQIELRFNGDRHVRTPIVIADKKIEISAQPGFRPRLILTAPVQIGLSVPTQMIRVKQGSLQFNNVDIEMHVKHIAAVDDWALIVLDRAKSVRMLGVSIKVVNPDDVPASIIEFAEPTDAELERMNLTMNMERVAAVDLIDCLVTGRCDLLRQNTIDPATVYLRNVATALRGTLMRIQGAEDGMNLDQISRVELQHVCAILEQGLLRVDTQISGDLLPMDVVCEDSLVLVRPDEPLIEMLGHQSSDSLKEALRFQDTRSYFDMNETAWVLSADGGVFPEDFNYQQFFSSQDPSVLISDPLRYPVDWEHDEFSEFGPDDFRLRSDSTLLSGRNGASAGVGWPERLPAAPVPEE
jgi:serine/threonine-protein kinase